MLDLRWGPHTCDSFACSYNAKLARFNARLCLPETEAVDAFIQNWEFDDNWLHPPVLQVVSVISHLRTCKAEESVVIPLWKSSYFGSCYAEMVGNGTHLFMTSFSCLCLSNCLLEAKVGTTFLVLEHCVFQLLLCTPPLKCLREQFCQGFVLMRVTSSPKCVNC